VKKRSMILAAAAAVFFNPVVVAQAPGGGAGNPFNPISYGETLSGYLTASDDSLQDGSLYKMFLFSGEAGDTVTISVNSLDFDAYLLFADSVDTILGSDNNAGGACNAQLTHVLPANGRYIVYATTNTAQQIGEFQVSIQQGSDAPVSSRPCGGFFEKNGVLSVGDSVMGDLGPPDPKLGPSYYQVWGIDVLQGQTVTIDLQSIIFDARLTLYRGFATAIDANDDGAGACNARIVMTGDGHPHSVVMTSGKQDETGPYILRVQEGALPIVQESQCEG